MNFLMIILNLSEKLSEVIRIVLQQKALAHIMYTERMRSVSKILLNVIHSIQQGINCVGHSGWHKEKPLYSKALLQQTAFAANRN